MEISKDMGIAEVVTKYPETIEVFLKYDMGCLRCMASRFENIEQGAHAHDIDINALIGDLNRAAKR